LSTSSNIWIRCAADSKIRALRIAAWRVVEAQHQVSTRKLVDSDAEQQLLEQLIEITKPPERTRSTLHYLLFTPFRYPPLRHGSRFGRKTDPGIWYGSEMQRTVFAEVAYYRLLFLEGTAAELGRLEAELTAFRAEIRTERGLDLTSRGFGPCKPALTSKTSYTATQDLGAAMRAANVAAFRYWSARDEQAGINVGVLGAAAFGRRAPKSLENWHCVATRAVVEFVRRDYFARAAFSFPRTQFLVAGSLPAPAI
jgi:hypothetical protein